MQTEINRVLLTHLETGGGAAWGLRNDCPDVVAAVASLFAARSDFVRLERAEAVAAIVLGRNDLSDLGAIRSIIARQELRRLIRYPKQRDHTAHTVYLYLLGIWLYDSVPALRSAITRTIGSGNRGPSMLFLNYWVFAGLLHDVGYVVYDLSGDTIIDRQALDERFSFQWIERNIPKTASREARLSLFRVHQSWQASYGSTVGVLGSCGPRDIEGVLRGLAAVPWVAEFRSGWVGVDGFDVLDVGGDGLLRAYANEVGTIGYKGNGVGACVDHAVASGLLLFQYSSYWYWLMIRLRVEDPSAYSEVCSSPGYHYIYELASLETYVVRACRAVAFHNIQGGVSVGKRILKRIGLRRDPITFLGILCDELQKWDRFPSGQELLEGFGLKEVGMLLEASDIGLSVLGDGREALAEFRVHESRGRAEELVSSLNSRLPGWNRVVRVPLETTSDTPREALLTQPVKRNRGRSSTAVKRRGSS